MGSDRARQSAVENRNPEIPSLEIKVESRPDLFGQSLGREDHLERVLRLAGRVIDLLLYGFSVLPRFLLGGSSSYFGFPLALVECPFSH